MIHQWSLYSAGSVVPTARYSVRENRLAYQTGLTRVAVCGVISAAIAAVAFGWLVQTGKYRGAIIISVYR